MDQVGNHGVEFRLLGALEVVAGDRVIEIGSLKQRCLLASLLLRLNRPVPVDVLVEELWGDAPPASVQATLQSLVSRLRRACETPEPDGDGDAVRLRGRDGGYVLEAAPDRVDAFRFERLVADGRDAARRGDPAGAAARLEAALALWRGPALGELADRPFARLEAPRLEEARLGAVEDLAEAELALGRPERRPRPARGPHVAPTHCGSGPGGSYAGPLPARPAGRRPAGLPAGPQASWARSWGWSRRPTSAGSRSGILRQLPELAGPAPASVAGSPRAPDGRHRRLPLHRHRSQHPPVGGRPRSDGERPRPPRRPPPRCRRGDGRRGLQPYRRRVLRRLPDRDRRPGSGRGRPSGRCSPPPGRPRSPLRVRMAVHAGAAEHRGRQLVRPGPQPRRPPARHRGRRPGAVLPGGGRARPGRAAGRRRPHRSRRAPPGRPGPARAGVPGDAPRPAGGLPGAAARWMPGATTFRWPSPRSWAGPPSSTRSITLLGTRPPRSPWPAPVERARPGWRCEAAGRRPRTVPRRRLAGRARLRPGPSARHHRGGYPSLGLLPSGLVQPGGVIGGQPLRPSEAAPAAARPRQLRARRRGGGPAGPHRARPLPGRRPCWPRAGRCSACPARWYGTCRPCPCLPTRPAVSRTSPGRTPSPCSASGPVPPSPASG